MNPLESLALLLADLNAQVRALQEENAALREVRHETEGELR